MVLWLKYEPQELVDTSNLSSEEWLSYRRRGIGGSDAAAILGISPWRTARDLYYDKLNVVKADMDENWVALEMGHLLEDLVARIFAKKTGLHIFQRKVMFQHPLYPWMLADLDYLVELPDGSNAILEIKTTNYNARENWWYNGEEIVPVYYESQGRHYMSVMNLDRVYFCCLYGNNEDEVIIRHLDRDYAYESELIALEDAFWNGHVQKRQLPDYTESGDLILQSLQRWKGIDRKDLPPAAFGAPQVTQIHQYLQLQEEKNALAKQVTQLDITEAIYNVMYQYRLAFTPDGVQANLNQWRQQKTPLLELLRRHPNWREEELAVVFDLSEQRQLDRACVDETKFEMLTLAEEAGLTSERLEEFRDALDAATADYATVPDESRLPVIRNRGHIKCDAGMKASRIINRLCAKFGIDQYEAERELGHGDTLHTARVKPYNAVFARLADALNPVRISKTGVLSVHPCDFLEMSAKKNAWHSCHCLADGGWRAGCQSYMGDSVSMVFFTVDDEVKDHFYCARRLTRQIFCYRDGVLLQSRLYPQNDDDVRKLYRSI